MPIYFTRFYASTILGAGNESNSILLLTMRTTEYKIIRTFDDLVRTYVKSVKDFFFIQVGANDGMRNDPLHHFILEFAWRGILIEPQQMVFENQLVKNYSGCDHLIFENVAIAEEDGQCELYKFSFSEKRWANGLASFNKAHLELHMENGYVERNIGDERQYLPVNPDAYISSEMVETMTFDTLLDKYQPDTLDLLQIDAEGYDYKLLQLYDFERIRPAIIQFEHHVMSSKERSDSLKRISNAGYLSFKHHINIVGNQRHLVEKLGVQFDVNDLRR